MLVTAASRWYLFCNHDWGGPRWICIKRPPRRYHKPPLLVLLDAEFFILYEQPSARITTNKSGSESWQPGLGSLGELLSSSALHPSSPHAYLIPPSVVYIGLSSPSLPLGTDRKRCLIWWQRLNMCFCQIGLNNTMIEEPDICPCTCSTSTFNEATRWCVRGMSSAATLYDTRQRLQHSLSRFSCPLRQTIIPASYRCRCPDVYSHNLPTYGSLGSVNDIRREVINTYTYTVTCLVRGYTQSADYLTIIYLSVNVRKQTTDWFGASRQVTSLASSSLITFDWLSPHYRLL